MQSELWLKAKQCPGHTNSKMRILGKARKNQETAIDSPISGSSHSQSRLARSRVTWYNGVWLLRAVSLQLSKLERNLWETVKCSNMQARNDTGRQNASVITQPWREWNEREELGSMRWIYGLQLCPLMEIHCSFCLSVFCCFIVCSRWWYDSAINILVCQSLLVHYS